MARSVILEVIVLVVLVDIACSLLQNATLNDIDNDLRKVETRRKKRTKKDQSTSSSGDRPDESSGDFKESLSISSAGSSTSEEHKKYKYTRPKSSRERTGWRKWHRKCTPCPEDMKKKWRDRSIRWICGAYQRARRTFKSDCMMRYRNCQDGTMFVKIHEHRCENDTGREKPHGDHFFYEYKVGMSDEADSDQSSASTSDMDVDTHEEAEWRRAAEAADKVSWSKHLQSSAGNTTTMALKKLN